MGDDARFRFGPFELDAGAFRLSRSGAAVPVEPKAFHVLRLLLERAPKVVDKAEIFTLVWKDVAVTDNALTRVIAQIRKALEDDPRTPRYIETVATRGYRFIAAVTPVAIADATADPPAGESLPGSTIAVGASRARSTWFLSAAAAAIVLLSAAAWVGSRFGPHGASSGVAPHWTGAPDIARFAAARPQQVTTGKGFDGFLTFAPDGKSMAYASDRSGALELYVQGVAAGSIATPLTNNGRHNVQPAWSPDGQFIAYHEMAGNGIWIVPSRGGVARKITTFGAHPAWSPDGRRIAFQSLPLTDVNPIRTPGALSTIWIVDAFNGKEPTAVTTAGYPAGPHLAPAWNRNSTDIYFANPTRDAARGTSLWSAGADGGQPRQISAHERLSPDYAVRPDGQGVYFVARGTNTIWWLPLEDQGESGAEPQPTGLPAVGSMISGLSLSPDGRRLAWTVIDSSSHLWATAGGNRPAHQPARPLTDGAGIHYGFPAPSSDGRTALVGVRHGSGANLFLLAAEGPPRQLTTDAGSHSGPSWLPGEREIAFVTDHGGEPAFWAVDPETGRERRLFPLSALPLPAGSGASTAAPAANIAFSRDFTRLAMSIVTDGAANIWTAPLSGFRPEGPLSQRTFERDGGSYPSWSPDGRWIAYQCAEGTDTHVCVIGRDGAGRTRLTNEAGQSWIGGWAPDGDGIIFASRRKGVWNVATVSRSTSAVRTLTDFTEPRFYVRYPRWDGAGGRAIFERSDTSGRIWTVDLP
jgi:Tol biopolymer transport system component/DNA-binding winged helix-turn-helix (wHTH) protein